MDFLDMIEILLNLIKSFREGNWHLHLHAVCAMLPWWFGYEHINYASYVYLCYALMRCLAATHPDMYNHFVNGSFAVQKTALNPFTKQPLHQVRL